MRSPIACVRCTNRPMHGVLQVVSSCTKARAQYQKALKLIGEAREAELLSEDTMRPVGDRHAHMHAHVHVHVHVHAPRR